MTDVQMLLVGAPGTREAEESSDEFEIADPAYPSISACPFQDQSPIVLGNYNERTG